VARIPDQRTTSSNGSKRHGDSGIAHLLAHYASKNPSAPIEWTPVPSRDERESNPDDWDVPINSIWA
jgi:phage FluMu gp28-like protein